MFNLWFGAIFMIVHFTLFLISYRMFGKIGVYAWIGMATVLANIQVVKTVELPLGIIVTLGNTMYGTIYLASDLLNEKYGEKAAKKAVWFGFFTLIATTVIMQLALLFEPHQDPFPIEVQGALETLFGLLPRIALGSLCAYLVSQFLDVKIYSVLKRMFPAPNKLWIRNNGSTLVSQLVDTLIFCTIAFAGEYENDVWLSIFLSTYIIKFIVSLVSTPFLYAARSFTFKDESGS
ncbi:queuosine precursor transporter [Paenibacillus harenae]|uniref:Probable queuosine precursor transporter n=1 Tax=Paenibacillus harenae TaxID=306543 RepID=A0ABT9U044_PAEHA|nr:queuosine precursor transporter [Paenibacillus harenae]MDQ0058339.1 putative integral membrane protein (TIGR00697 family) [Paenibacillus harenae]MDQ0111684.1 putative integral membrane protein (TIGR00697 family) [Paenibacillus harenae]